MTNPSSRKMSQKSQGMGDESTSTSVSATCSSQWSRGLVRDRPREAPAGRIFYNASAPRGGPHERSRQVDDDGQGRRLSSQAESRDAGLRLAAAAAAN